MTGARKFLFDRDFRDGSPTGAQVAVTKAEETGYARGLGDGQRIATEAATTRLAASMEQLVGLAKALLGREAERDAAAEHEAADLALAFASKIAGEALAHFPVAALEEAARECFRHLRGVPHLVVRINDGLVEEADALMQRSAHQHGFEGRIVVFGDPEIAPGDVRLEWADGGVVRDQAALQNTIAEAVARTLHQSGTAIDGET